MTDIDLICLRQEEREPGSPTSSVFVKNANIPLLKKKKKKKKPLLPVLQALVSIHFIWAKFIYLCYTKKAFSSGLCISL